MRAVLPTLLLLVATLVSAASVKVTEFGDTVYYVEPESIARTNNYETIYRAAVVHDYAKPEPSGVRSRKVWYEINCSAERLRSVSATEYSAPLAQGNSVNSWQRESEWLYIAPVTGTNIPAKTPYRPIVKYVCSR